MKAPERLLLVDVDSPGHGRRRVIRRQPPAAQRLAAQPPRDRVEHHLAATKPLGTCGQQPLDVLRVEVHQQPFRHDEDPARLIDVVHPPEVER